MQPLFFLFVSFFLLPKFTVFSCLSFVLSNMIFFLHFLHLLPLLVSDDNYGPRPPPQPPKKAFNSCPPPLSLSSFCSIFYGNFGIYMGEREHHILLRLYCTLFISILVNWCPIFESRMSVLLGRSSFNSKFWN